MSNIVKNYFRVLKVISSLGCQLEYKSGVGRKEKMSDLEIVAMSLTAEFMSIDSENSLFKQITKAEIPNLIERSQFNKRRKKKFYFPNKLEQSWLLIFWSLKIILLSIVCRWKYVNSLVITELKSVRMNLKLHLQKAFVLRKTIGFMDTNFTEFAL
jgi:hypothetical protein